MIESIARDIVVYLPYSLLYILQLPKDMLPLEYTEKSEWIQESIPEAIQEVIGMDRLLDTSFLLWKEEYIGSSDYIDRIRELPVPMMMGKDCYGRAFIAIRTFYKNTKCQITVLFQRYSDDIHTWTYGTCHQPCWMKNFMYFCQNNQIIKAACSDTIQKILNHEDPDYVWK